MVTLCETTGGLIFSISSSDVSFDDLSNLLLTFVCQEKYHCGTSDFYVPSMMPVFWVSITFQSITSLFLGIAQFLRHSPENYIQHYSFNL